MDLFTNKKLWMPDMVEDGLLRGGDKTFAILMHSDGSRQDVSYKEIREQGIALMEKLAAAGVKKGDRLGVISALRPWWYSVLYAALHGGYRMVCIDPAVPAAQIKSMLRQTQVRAVLTTLRSVELPKRLTDRIPVYSIQKDFPVINGCDSVDMLLESVDPVPEDTFFILFSSGTTGENRKGVLLPHTTVTMGIEYGMCTDGGVYKNKPSYTPRKRDLMLFPPYHIAGLLCAVYDVYCNTEVIMLERLTPNALSYAMQDLKPDNICTVPSMLALLMKKMKVAINKNIFTKLFVNGLLNLSGFLRRTFGWKAGRRLLGFLNKKAFGGNMDGFMIGGSACDAASMKFFLDMGIDVSIAYGLTELGAPLAVSGQGYYPGTTGRVIRHTDKMDIRVVNKDESGKGEVEILSPYRMISYLNPDDNEGCFTEDGYFRSGDIGYFDKNDCLVICGRSKEAIVLRNGEKLLPEEIESHFQNILDAGDAAAFKVPEEGGWDSFSVAVVKANKALPDEIIKLHVLDRVAELPPVYTPKEIYIVHELPLSSNHKVQRFRLTEMALNGLSDPVNEASMCVVDEDGTVSELRELLVKAGGSQWKTAELTEGLLLNLDSLQNIDLFVMIQDHFGIDLFKLANQPETFGALLDAVKNYDEMDKNTKSELNLENYPQPVKDIEKFWFGGVVESFAKLVYNVHGVGMENLPTDTNYLICSNHITVLDPGWISSCLTRAQKDNTCIVGKSDLLEDKTLKDFVRSHNLIPVDRTGNSLATLDRCKELLEEGWNIVIFPEGTNNENGSRMISFKEGPARLSISTGRPIVPAHIKGVKLVNTDQKSFLPPIGGRIEIAFGEPIYPGDMTPVQLNAVLKSAIENL